MKRSLEQRLHEACRLGEGLRLSAEDVMVLMFGDAIAARINNVTVEEAGVKPPGSGTCPTWRKLREERHWK